MNVNKGNKPSLLSGSRDSYRIIILMSLAGMVLSIMAFVMARSWETNKILLELHIHSNDHFMAVKRSVESKLELLKNLGAFYAASETVRRDKFNKFTKPLLKIHSDIQALEWIPRVPDSQRRAYETSARSDGFSEFRITEKNFRGALVAAAQREKYFPVYFVAPYRGNEPALGFDLASDSKRGESLNQARDSGKIGATARIRLVQETGEQFGFLIFLPIYRKGAAVDTIANRRYNLEGFFLGVFRIGDLVEKALDPLKSEDINVIFYDSSAPANDSFLYYYSPRKDEESQPPPRMEGAKKQKRAAHLHTLTVAGRKWSMLCTPTANFFAVRRTWQPWIVIALFLMLSQSVVAYLLMNKRRVFQLSEANRSFQKEIEERKRLEKELSKTMQQSRLLLESAGEGIFGVNLREMVTFINPAAALMLGYTIEELIDQNIHSLIHHTRFDGSPYPLEDCPMHASYIKGAIYNISDEVLWRKDGSSFPVEYSSRPIRDEYGIVGAVVIFRDITDRRKADKALKASEERFRGLLESAPDCLVIINSSGEIMLVNKQTETMFGYAREEILGRPVEMLIPKRFKKKHAAHRAKYFMDPQIRQMGTNLDLYASRKDQSEFPIDVSLSPMTTEEGVFVSAAIRDISEQRETEEQLRKLARAVEQSPSVAVITDVDGSIQYVNPKFEKITGYSAEEAIGQNPRFLSAGKHPLEMYKDLWETITSGNEWRGEFCNRKKNGEIYWEQASISPVRNRQGEITHFVGVKEDITERRQAAEELEKAKEAAEEATRAKSEFLANMSHEIRTPMNAIIGLGHLTLQTELTPKQNDYLSKIRSSAQSLLGIINDILDFSKIEAGKLDIEPVEFDLDEVLRNVSSMISINAQERALELVFNTDREVPLKLVGDPLRLSQILLNLTNNAIKFTESGEIVVSTNLVGEEADQVTLKFSVRDTGIGLNRKQISKLFEPFSQADGSTTRSYGGTGLGLTISKQLAELMGGEIGVESEIGQGSIFFFTAKFTRQSMDRRKYRLPGIGMKGMRVLVVDESACSQVALRNFLGSFSFNVTIVASGEDAIRELQKAQDTEDKRYKLVLLDWKISGVTGIEIATRIKQDPEIPNIPIIIMTPYGRKDLMKQAEEAGMEAVISKPVHRSELFETILDLFGEGGARQSQVALDADRISEKMDAIRGARILLVEDNEINQQVATELLENAGLVVTVANNGKEAVQAVTETDYDLVLMDLQMPVMGGLEAAGKIRNNPRFKKLPIIAMTAHAMSEDRKKSLKAGMNDHVTKPIDPNHLYSVLAEWIEPGERKIPTPHTPKPVEKDADQDTPPLFDLPGISVSSGLAKVGGNREFYRNLLMKFKNNYTNVINDIKNAIRDNDKELAQRLAHTIKGLSGTIGAEGLFQAASDLETAFMQGKADELESLLNSFEISLNEVMASIQSLDLHDTDTASEDETGSDQSTPIDVVKVAPILVELAELIEDDITEALERMESLKRLLTTSSVRYELKKIEDSMREYDTDTALENLGLLAKTLNISLKGD